MEAIYPDGRVEMLNHVDRFDFNWHVNYVYADDVGAGAAEGHDHQDHRVARQHGRRTRRTRIRRSGSGWGQRSFDDMYHAHVNVTYLTDEDYEQITEERAARAVRHHNATAAAVRHGACGCRRRTGSSSQAVSQSRSPSPIQSTVSATNSAGVPTAPTATTMYCRPLARYVIGMPLWFAGSLNSETISPGLLVVRAEHRAARPGRHREQPRAFAREQQRLRHQQPDVLVAAGPRQRDALQRRMVLDPVRRLAVRRPSTRDRRCCRSIAVMRPYGGLMSGSPCGPNMRGPGGCAAALGRRRAALGGVEPMRAGFRRRRLSGLRLMHESTLVPDATYSMPVSGSTAPPCQFAPPVMLGSISTARCAVRAGDDRRREERPELVLRDHLRRLRPCSSGVKSIRSSSVTPWRSNGAGLVGNGCVGDVFSPGTSDCGTGRSSIGQTGGPVTRSKT